MTECVLHGAGHCCHGDSVTHGGWIWIYNSALFCVFMCLCVCVICACISMFENVPVYVNSFIYGCVLL